MSGIKIADIKTSSAEMPATGNSVVLQNFPPLPHTCDLDRLLCAEYQRSLSCGSTVSLNGKTFFIDQNKFGAKTKVTLLLSEKHGLRALINGEFYPIVMLEKGKTNTIIHPDHMPFVVKELIKNLMLKNAKAA